MADETDFLGMSPKKAAQGGFRKLELNAIIEVAPDRAREQILAAYRVAGASLRATANVLGCTERTLHRWVDRLELRDDLDKMTRKAQREGWLNKARRPGQR